MTTDLCLILAVHIILAICAVCSNVPVNLGRSPFDFFSAYLLALTKLNSESRIQEMKMLSGTLSRVIGLKLAGL